MKAYNAVAYLQRKRGLCDGRVPCATTKNFRLELKAAVAAAYLATFVVSALQMYLDDIAMC